MAQTGLIKNEMSTGFDPKKNELKPEDTVEGRITNILKKDSPLLQDARTRSLQGMNTRGLINSSMALGEGEKAAMAAALPIASQDASSSLTVSRDNQQANNQAMQFGAGSENQVGLQKLQGAQSVELATLQGNIQKELVQLESASKKTMQTSDSAARFYSQTAASISEILKEPNISVESKQQLVQKQIDLLKSGMAVIGGINNLNLTDLLNFEGTSLSAPAPAAPATAIAHSSPSSPGEPGFNWDAVDPNDLYGRTYRQVEEWRRSTSG